MPAAAKWRECQICSLQLQNFESLVNPGSPDSTDCVCLRQRHYTTTPMTSCLRLRISFILWLFKTFHHWSGRKMSEVWSNIPGWGLLVLMTHTCPSGRRRVSQCTQVPITPGRKIDKSDDRGWTVESARCKKLLWEPQNFAQHEYWRSNT